MSYVSLSNQIELLYFGPKVSEGYILLENRSVCIRIHLCVYPM